jgi:hypothetical protein
MNGAVPEILCDALIYHTSVSIYPGPQSEPLLGLSLTLPSLARSLRSPIDKNSFCLFM